MTGDALAAGAGAALSRDEVARRITDAYEGVVPVPSWGETSFFYNPGRAFTRGAYFCTLKDHDGENDRASALDRPGVYRLAFGVPPSTFGRLFGPRPPRPGKGGVVEGPWDFTALDRLTPHPVYAWMGWLSVLNPSARTFDLVGPLLAQAHERARMTFEKRLRR
ncbi:MAG TPA: DUF6194 family protein [Polyangiaceae bacterium]|nr:DUF6194 family protein [Polyangiaceae bacterium]